LCDPATDEKKEGGKGREGRMRGGLFFNLMDGEGRGLCARNKECPPVR